MKKTIAIMACFALAFTLSACGGSAKADTPEEVFENMKKVVKDKDFGGLYDMLSKDSQSGIEKSKEKAIPVLEKTSTVVPEEKMKEDLEKRFGVSSLDEFKAMSTRDFFVRLFSELTKDDDNFEKMDKATIEECKYSKDEKSATLTIKEADGKTNDMKVVLEDGSWRLDMSEMFGG